MTRRLKRRRQSRSLSFTLERGKSRLGRISSALTPDKISSLAAAAGFSGDDLVTAVAVALAESGGDPRAYNPEGSYGLWQIYVPAHPEFAGDDLYDPAKNAAVAFRVYSDAGGTFRPWTTYKTGAYLRYMSTAEQGVMADARGDGWDPAANDQAANGGVQPAAIVSLDLNNMPTSTKQALAVGAVAVGAWYAVKWLFD